jgi:hypothetical protein
MSLPCHENKFGIMGRYSLQSWADTAYNPEAQARVLQGFTASLSEAGWRENMRRKEPQCASHVFYTQCKAQVHPQEPTITIPVGKIRDEFVGNNIAAPITGTTL